MGAIVSESSQIDAVDLQILRAFLADGRMSIQALSEKIGLSPTPIARRVKRLEQAGIITGYAALIDEEALGFQVAVFVSVKLDRQIDHALSTFETAIKRLPEVSDCWLMTGNRDYLLRVVTRSMREFEAFLVGRLTKIEGVAGIESSIPLRRVKSSLSRTF
ncbi:Lrp/AsnC family transcriptional regulator [Jiella pacifica]|uniref:Winged helix-turn-helix transcriptional regulator n=1 Tax=Jiella pacifica TaxID=2696469 RepID=A0A6N9T2R2_9HYPH|nr:Lrp/AsnC family transcriptional regulator [Jiella pacifica]NDW05647.1 winged helix-turn-helix transcriptional regulator [Jiella pacifica]